MSKLIFVLLDALCYETAQTRAGYLEHLAEAGLAAKYRVRGELPSLSRPMYETLMTGVSVSRHGTCSNAITRHSVMPSLFSLARDAGLVTAAAAYSWLLELYGDINRPFKLNTDRYRLDGSGSISHGIFYSSDDYPDSHVFADAEFLRTTYHPDFLLTHTMSIDLAGHAYGSDSTQYARAAYEAMELVAQLIDGWRQDGYDVIVTSDHGMDALGWHGGNTSIQREVPLYILSGKVKHGDFSAKPISQLNLAPLACRLMGIPKGGEMIDDIIE